MIASTTGVKKFCKVAFLLLPKLWSGILSFLSTGEFILKTSASGEKMPLQRASFLRWLEDQLCFQPLLEKKVWIGNGELHFKEGGPVRSRGH